MTETSPPALAVATSDRVRLAMRAAADTKAEEIRVLSLATVADFADYFLFASGANERQVQAIADRIEEQLREAGARPLHVEGQAAGQWVLLDYGDLVAHVFLEERRRFYGLERLWNDAPDVTADFAS
ncbi:MAG: ribosome silencing factor [Thermoanaerobaculia bacterium]|nr:MAG: ribosome silencing factor [Thermoanaerobaculia bacterium]MBZ0102326.1 ribosome silencing factor [Thermoanaerobaculia bacterium]